jgi:hypothetical protein
MRMFDRMLVEGVRAFGGGRMAAFPPGSPLTESLMVFDIENVAQYYFAHWKRDHHQSPAYDIPSLAPPYAFFWMEFTARRAFAEAFQPALAPGARCGVLFMGVDLEHPPGTIRQVNPPLFDEWRQAFDRYMAGATTPLRRNGKQFAPPAFADDPAQRRAQVWAFMLGLHPASMPYEIRHNNQDSSFSAMIMLAHTLRDHVSVRWLLHAVVYVEDPARGVLEALAQFDFPLRPDGRLFDGGLDASYIHTHILAPEWFVGPNVDATYRRVPTMYETMSHVVHGDALAPALLALGFLHAKNVTVDELVDDAPEAPAHRPKRQAARPKRPPTRFHVLNITPLQRVLAREGQVDAQGLRVALHLCRGHFKTYSAEKPLFGRVVGTYWWADHVRGPVDEGVVEKEYRIQPPEAAPTTPRGRPRPPRAADDADGTPTKE